MCMTFGIFFVVRLFRPLLLTSSQEICYYSQMAPFAYKPFLGNRGFGYIALLVAIVIIGISTTAVVRSGSNIARHDREKELLFRGDQYRTAIGLYLKANAAFPQSIDDLLKDPKTVTKHYLRQRYKDPISGEDFVEVRDPMTHRIIGVYSPSEKEPFKKANFSEQNKDFEGKTMYSEWQFVYKPPPGSLLPGQNAEGSGAYIRHRYNPNKPGL
jgi:type II secretory pathway pseudopilin PulG